jgi:predicted dehydrogenase
MTRPGQGTGAGPGTGARPPASVALIGARGHGANHLRHLRGLHAEGRLRLVAVCDLAPLDDDTRAGLPAGTRFFTSHRELLAEVSPEVVVIATPPPTHLPIATDAALAGANLLLEKPPVASLAEHDQLTEVLHRTGRHCQVGFQALGSAALAELLRAVGTGALGTVESVASTGTWIRTDSYWARAPWAGRRYLGGRAVTDGALSNPFGHSIMNALAIAAAAAAEDAGAASLPERIEVELYRTRDLEVDEIGCVRLTMPNGVVLLVAVTLCAERHRSPLMIVRGGAGEATLDYKRDVLQLPGDRAPRHVPGRADLVENLLDHRADPERVPLVAPLAATRPFTHVVEAIHGSPPPRRIDPGFLRVSGVGGERRIEVLGVDDAIHLAAARLALIAELDVAWASADAVHQATPQGGVARSTAREGLAQGTEAQAARAQTAQAGQAQTAQAQADAALAQTAQAEGGAAQVATTQDAGPRGGSLRS